MEAITEWCDSDSNDEYFYIEDAGEQEGRVYVSVAGRYTFLIKVDDLSITCKDARAPVARWTQALQEKKFATVEELLRKATEEYKAISDALDELDEEGMDQDEDDEGAHDVAIEAVPTSQLKTPEQIEQERAFEELLMTLVIPKNGNQASTERILSDYRNIYLSKTRFGWNAAPSKGDIYNWDIELFDFEKGTALYDDFQKLKAKGKKDRIEMTLTFPPEYPFKPPFLRIIRPRFQYHTGRVTLGGSICHEMLTNKGWKPVNDIESIVTTIRAEITDTEAGARLDLNNEQDYS
eukprot:gene11611-17903_t